jgi:hypothetical protein
MIEIEEGYSLILKILVPSLIAISVKLAIQIKNGSTSALNACLSIIIGVGCAYLSGELIISRFSESVAPIVIGVVTITGEKIAFWLMYKFNVDGFMDVFYESFRNWIAKK